MKIAVVNGTEKRGVTYRLKELFLQEFRGRAEVVEFVLPKDAPAFCCGCARCVLEGEASCKDYAYIDKIRRALEEADLILFASPVYVMHVTGGMKAFLDHCAPLFMAHRPSPSMFLKRAVILTQCLGAGSKSAAKDIEDSMGWWGISEIGVFRGSLFGDTVWENLSPKRRKKLERGVGKLAEKFSRKDYSRPPRVSWKVKFRFFLCRMIQKSVYREHPQSADGAYWSAQGWFGKARPWKSGGRASR